MKRRGYRQCREPGCKLNVLAGDGGRCKVHTREYAARLIARAEAAPSELRDGREFAVTVLPDDARLRAPHRRR